MELVRPEVVSAVGGLPVLTVCLLVIFGQFVLAMQQSREMRREIQRIALMMERVLVRFEDWLAGQNKE